MPVIISTSSIALQNSIMNDYIPSVSKILMEHGIIESPLSCVLRKGRERFICEKNLHIAYHDGNAPVKGMLLPILNNTHVVDLAQSDSLPFCLKKRIMISGYCGRDCPVFRDCRYQRHMEDMRSNWHDFQIVNHNYLLADLIRRSEGKKPLIPTYQAIIIDEAHKFLQSARQIYGTELAQNSIPQTVNSIRGIAFGAGEGNSNIEKQAAKLTSQNKSCSSA